MDHQGRKKQAEVVSGKCKIIKWHLDAYGRKHFCRHSAHGVVSLYLAILSDSEGQALYLDETFAAHRFRRKKCQVRRLQEKKQLSLGCRK